MHHFQPPHVSCPKDLAEYIAALLIWEAFGSIRDSAVHG